MKNCNIELPNTVDQGEEVGRVDGVDQAGEEVDRADAEGSIEASDQAGPGVVGTTEKFNRSTKHESLLPLTPLSQIGLDNI